MTWTASVMPDDALDPDSLVGRMIHGWEPRPQSPEEVAAGLRQAFRKCIKDGVVSPLPVSEPPPATLELLPLWLAMARAEAKESGSQASQAHQFSRGYIQAWAPVILALRDWLFPSGPPMFGTEIRVGHIYNQLTKEAAIARGER